MKRLFTMFLVASVALAGCGGQAVAPVSPPLSPAHTPSAKLIVLPNRIGIELRSTQGAPVLQEVATVQGVRITSASLGVDKEITDQDLARGTMQIGNVTFDLRDTNHITWSNHDGSNTGTLDLENGRYYMSVPRLGWSHVALAPDAALNHRHPMMSNACAAATRAYILAGVAWASAVALAAAAPEIGPVDIIAIASATAALQDAINAKEAACAL